MQVFPRPAAGYSTEEAHVAIIGAGIAGLSLALSLYKRSISCKVYETNEPQHDQGILILSPNGLRVLHALGLYDLVRTRGYSFDDLTFRNNVTVKIPLGSKQEYGFSALRIARDEVVDILRSKALEVNIPIFYRKMFHSIISENLDRVIFKFTDGTESSASLLIGADGVGSVVRRHISPQHSSLWFDSVVLSCVLQGTELTKYLHAIAKPGKLDPVTSLYAGPTPTTLQVATNAVDLAAHERQPADNNSASSLSARGKRKTRTNRSEATATIQTKSPIGRQQRKKLAPASTVTPCSEHPGSGSDKAIVALMDLLTALPTFLIGKEGIFVATSKEDNDEAKSGDVCVSVVRGAIRDSTERARTLDRAIETVTGFALAEGNNQPGAGTTIMKYIRSENLHFWPYYRLPHLHSWASSIGRVITIGDAAHTVPPTTGQGVSQALEDAYTLAGVIFANFSCRTSWNEDVIVWQHNREDRVRQAVAFAEKVDRTREAVAGYGRFTLGEV